MRTLLPLEEIAAWGIQMLQHQLSNFNRDLIAGEHQQLWSELQKLLKNTPKESKENLLLKKQFLLKQYPALQVNIEFLDLVISHYIDLLTGSISILNLLFANGNFDFISRLYESNPTSAYYNKLMAMIIAEQVKANASILELGAGIGGTTRQLLPLLKGRCGSYHYTDVSKAFLIYGKQQFGQDNPFMQFSLFDINILPAVQNQEEEKYNIILATDVLHNAKDIEQTIQHLYKILKPGGLLFINETTPKSNYSTLIFGLTSAWWEFTDPSYRIPGSPLLTIENWLLVLKKAGFQNASVFEQSISIDRPLGQEIIISSKAIE
jgi:polyketide synthase PksM